MRKKPLKIVKSLPIRWLIAYEAYIITFFEKAMTNLKTRGNQPKFSYI